MIISSLCYFNGNHLARNKRSHSSKPSSICDYLLGSGIDLTIDIYRFDAFVEQRVDDMKLDHDFFLTTWKAIHCKSWGTLITFVPCRICLARTLSTFGVAGGDRH